MVLKVKVYPNSVRFRLLWALAPVSNHRLGESNRRYKHRAEFIPERLGMQVAVFSAQLDSDDREMQLLAGVGAERAGRPPSLWSGKSHCAAIAAARSAPDRRSRCK